jgi:hypothetical protein
LGSFGKKVPSIQPEKWGSTTDAHDSARIKAGSFPPITADEVNESEDEARKSQSLCLRAENFTKNLPKTGKKFPRPAQPIEAQESNKAPP